MGCCESRNATNLKKNIKEDIKENPEKNNSKYFVRTDPNLYKPKMTIQPKISKPTEVKNMDENLNYYRKLMTIRMLNNCVDSEVYLCERDVIRKTYPDTSEGMGNFKNEIGTYRVIGHLPFVPKLLCVDDERLTFWWEIQMSHPNAFFINA